MGSEEASKASYIREKVSLQRLFSTFANGWPGKGLILLRLAIASYVVHDSLVSIGHGLNIAAGIAQLIALLAGVCILVGFWTPIAGTLTALLQSWDMISQLADTWTAGLAAAIALGLALLGPGAYSLDALAYGRRRISIENP